MLNVMRITFMFTGLCGDVGVSSKLDESTVSPGCRERMEAYVSDSDDSDRYPDFQPGSSSDSTIECSSNVSAPCPKKKNHYKKRYGSENKTDTRERTKSNSIKLTECAEVDQHITEMPQQTGNLTSISEQCEDCASTLDMCKGCFVKTLGKTNKFVEMVVNKKRADQPRLPAEDGLGKQSPRNKITEELKQVVTNHLLSIPSYENHYTRRDSSKKYLPQHWTLAALYEDYKKIIQTTQSTEQHHREADAAYNAKDKDKQISKINPTMKTPVVSTYIAFYKRQFNFTVHDRDERQAQCFVRDESIVGRGANKVSSCLYKYLFSLEPCITHITTYSDTCGGQNKKSCVCNEFSGLEELHNFKDH
ncbi:hypothetical protein PR048_006142 [Dryococelus australis]|uniref:Uncharacterized protein n=1 Tax=Dryococelus australis TaxID=614101 RepID=A0ABQ9IB87_9NEOP|nr:hypothetical protein PR048_006142 [Dryococelus australis]